MRGATRKMFEVWFGDVLGRLLRIEARLPGLLRTSREAVTCLHEAEDRANERHALVMDAVGSIETQLKITLNKLLERQTRSIAVQKHDRRAVPVDRVTSLPTPAPKPGGTSTAMAVLRGEQVPVVPRVEDERSRRIVQTVAPASPQGPSQEIVSAREAAEQLSIGRAGQKALVRLCNAGLVDGAVLKPSRSGGWMAPLGAFKAAYSKAE